MNKKSIFILLGLFSIALGVCFYYTPFWAVSNMKKAAAERDADTLSEYVDFPSLKESLKANFNTMMATEVSKNTSDNPFGAFGAALATVLINPMIDNLVTPEGLAMLMKGETPEMEEANRKGEENRFNTNKNTETTMSYDSFHSFIVTIKEKDSSDDPMKIIFKRHGIISWKLSAVRLPLSKKEDKNVEASPDSSKAGTTASRKEKKSESEPALLTPTLSNKRFQESDFSKGIYEDAIWFDISWDTSRLKQATRAVKGILIIGDIFGESQFRLNVTINDPLTPGQSYTQQGVGFDYNQFTDSHRWFRVTDLRDMTFDFEVKDIIYLDDMRDAEQGTTH